MCPFLYFSLAYFTLVSFCTKVKNLIMPLPLNNVTDQKTLMYIYVIIVKAIAGLLYVMFYI